MNTSYLFVQEICFYVPRLLKKKKKEKFIIFVEFTLNPSHPELLKLVLSNLRKYRETSKNLSSPCIRIFPTKTMITVYVGCSPRPLYWNEITGEFYKTKPLIKISDTQHFDPDSSSERKRKVLVCLQWVHNCWSN